jgi:biotin carboxyl carrier protein
MKYVTTIGEREFTIEVLDEKHILLDNTPFEIDFNTLSGQSVFSLILAGASYEAIVYTGEEGMTVLLHGTQYSADVEDERDRRLRASMGAKIAEREEYHLRAPMPGLVIHVLVADGQHVEKGEVLVILESMKMQNELKTPRAGVVARLRVHPGDSVEQRQTLLSVV